MHTAETNRVILAALLNTSVYCDHARGMLGPLKQSHAIVTNSLLWNIYADIQLAPSVSYGPCIMFK